MFSLSKHGHLLTPGLTAVYYFDSNLRYTFCLSWPRQPHVYYCENRRTAQFPSLHLDHGILLQPGHSDWKGGCGGILNRNERTRQYVLSASVFAEILTASKDPKIRRSLVTVAVLNIVLNIPQCLLVWLQCDPVDALWDPLRQAQCDHRKTVYYTYFVGVVAALTDFYLAIVPIHMLLPLRIDRKLKWGLSFLMGCGIFAGVAAIVRTWAAKFIISEDSSCKSSKEGI